MENKYSKLLLGSDYSRKVEGKNNNRKVKLTLDKKLAKEKILLDIVNNNNNDSEEEKKNIHNYNDINIKKNKKMAVIKFDNENIDNDIKNTLKYIHNNQRVLTTCIHEISRQVCVGCVERTSKI